MTTGHEKVPSSPERFHSVVTEGLKLYNECLETRTIRACVYDGRINERLHVSCKGTILANNDIHSKVAKDHTHAKSITNTLHSESM